MMRTVVSVQGFGSTSHAGGLGLSPERPCVPGSFLERRGRLGEATATLKRT